MGHDGTSASVPAHGAAWFAQSRNWSGYFDAMVDTLPRPLLLKAIRSFEDEGAPTVKLAGDLGCGQGRDTVELLRCGWRVLAIDSEPEAIDRLLAQPDLTRHDHLQTRVSAFDEMELPQAALINAAYSLPFCPPEHFHTVWESVVDAIEPGGRFVGQLFGDRDEWAGKSGFSHHCRGELDELFSKFIIEYLQEEEMDSIDELGYHKHWHIFHLVARKRAE
jgi:SAM-dependent methyltransferase